jgi:hypothetical protein
VPGANRLRIYIDLTDERKLAFSYKILALRMKKLSKKMIMPEM